MRDQSRMKILLDLINDIWMKDPDMRFNQLIYLLQHSYSIKNGKIGKIDDVASDGYIRTGFDLFNVEDDSFIKYLEEVKISGEF